MLQQTTVATVAPRFARWMRRYPDIATLAAASERDVLREWEGLGYYSRARNLLAAARLVARNGGRMPEERSDLLALPGIGEYTASAIRSIAFGHPEPVLDANVRRVAQRLLMLRAWNRSSEAKARAFLESAIPRRRPGRFNEAMMELGALACLPKNPRCGACPIAAFCAARAAGRENAIPARKRRTVTRLRGDVWLVLHGREILVRRRGDGEIGSGLWSFPEHHEPAFPDSSHNLPAVTHAFTRFRRTLRPRVCFSSRRFPAPADARWLPLSRLDALPFPTAYRKIALALRDHLDTLSDHGAH